MRGGNRLVLSRIFRGGVNRDLAILYLIAIVSTVLCVVFWGVQYNSDSQSYIDAWRNFSAGKIDGFRTPVYPLILNCAKWIFGASCFDIAVVCLQHLITLVTMRHVYDLACKIVGRRTIAFWITFVYVFSLVLKWDNYILTESLACNGMILLLYSLYGLYMHEGWKYLITFAILLPLLIFLRPALIYLLPVLFVWLLLVAYKKQIARAIVSVCMGIVVLVAAVQLCYMSAFEKTYGIFAVSKISVINQLWIALDQDLINIDLIEQDELKKDIAVIDAEIFHGDLAFKICDKYGVKTIDKMLRTSYKRHPVKYIQKCFGRVFRSTMNGHYVPYMPGVTTLIELLGFDRMNAIYWIILVYTFVLCRWIVQKRNLPLFTLLIYALGISNLIVIILGAPNDYTRLAHPSMLLYLLMLGQLCTLFLRKPAIADMELC